MSGSSPAALLSSGASSFHRRAPFNALRDRFVVSQRPEMTIRLAFSMESNSNSGDSSAGSWQANSLGLRKQTLSSKCLAMSLRSHFSLCLKRERCCVGRPSKWILHNKLEKPTSTLATLVSEITVILQALAFALAEYHSCGITSAVSQGEQQEVKPSTARVVFVS